MLKFVLQVLDRCRREQLLLLRLAILHLHEVLDRLLDEVDELVARQILAIKLLQLEEVLAVALNFVICADFDT